MTDMLDISALPPEIAAAVRTLTAACDPVAAPRTALTLRAYLAQELPGLQQGQKA